MDMFRKPDPPEPRTPPPQLKRPLLSKLVDFISGRSGVPHALKTTADLDYGWRYALIQKPIINAADPARYVPFVMPLGINDLGGRVPLNYVSGDGSFPILDGTTRVYVQQGVGNVDQRGAVFVGAMPAKNT